jgi:hypothetical protein
MDLRERSWTDARVADRDGAVLGDLSSAHGFPPRHCSRPARVVPDDAARKRHGRLLLNAPLKDWIRIHGFDSATECEQAKAFWMTEAGYRSMLDEAARGVLPALPRPLTPTRVPFATIGVSPAATPASQSTTPASPARKLARYLSTPDTSLSPEELERLREILKQTNRPFYYELQMPAAKRPEEEEEEEEEEDEDDGKKEENEEEDEQQEPWRLT